MRCHSSTGGRHLPPSPPHHTLPLPSQPLHALCKRTCHRHGRTHTLCSTCVPALAPGPVAVRRTRSAYTCTSTSAKPRHFVPGRGRGRAIPRCIVRAMQPHANPPFSKMQPHVVPGARCSWGGMEGGGFTWSRSQPPARPSPSPPLHAYFTHACRPGVSKCALGLDAGPSGRVNAPRTPAAPCAMAASCADGHGLHTPCPARAAHERCGVSGHRWCGVHRWASAQGRGGRCCYRLHAMPCMAASFCLLHA